MRGTSSRSGFSRAGSRTPDEARRELDRLATDDFRGIRRVVSWITAICLLAIACCALRDGRRAAVLYGALRPRAVPNAIGALPVSCLGATARYLALLAWTAGDTGQAAIHFEEALALNARWGARPWLAATQYDYARMLLERAGNGDHEKAYALVRQAACAAREIGMAGLAARAAALASGRTSIIRSRRKIAPAGSVT